MFQKSSFGDASRGEMFWDTGHVPGHGFDIQARLAGGPRNPEDKEQTTMQNPRSRNIRVAMSR